MPEQQNKKQDNDNKIIKILGEKIDNLTSVMQKFGLDLITKLGKSESRLNILADKIDNLTQATINIKSFSPILSKIVDNQESIESELDLLRSLMQKSNFTRRPSDMNAIDRDESITKNLSLIEKQFSSLKNQIDSNEDSNEIIGMLEKIKEDLFEITGGHRILYEISQFIGDIRGLKELNDNIKSTLKEKIVFWTNKLK
ncbi:MAG: hypothetical protein ACFFAS_15030 [Promethearchaeota archaeon]